MDFIGVIVGERDLDLGSAGLVQDPPPEKVGF